jgi:hypothetical protein
MRVFSPLGVVATATHEQCDLQTTAHENTRRGDELNARARDALSRERMTVQCRAPNRNLVRAIPLGTGV